MLNDPAGAPWAAAKAARDLKVTLVDYGYGNVRSVARALERAGVTPVLSADPKQLLDADAAVLPGVGAGDSAMKALNRLELAPALREFIVDLGRPFLGLCLGQHLLLDRTEEGDIPCLGVVKGRVRRLPEGQKVPHMGWNLVETAADHPVLRGVPNPSYFYFVHSYYSEPADDSVVLGRTSYGVEFCSILAVGRVVATQFHPEKSGRVGLRIYRNFVEGAALEG